MQFNNERPKQSAVNDKYTVTREQAETIIKDICISYSPIRFRFNERYSDIEKAFGDKDLEKLCFIMSEVFAIKDGLLKRVGTSGKLKGEGTTAVLHSTHYGDFLISADIVFSYSRDEIFSMPMGYILYVIAHELSHLKMFSDRHKHAISEFATDILSSNYL